MTTIDAPGNASRLRHLGTALLVENDPSEMIDLKESFDVFGYTDHVSVHPDEINNVAAERSICVTFIRTSGKSLDSLKQVLNTIRSNDRIAKCPVVFILSGVSEEIEQMCLVDGGSWTARAPIVPACLETVWHPLVALNIMESELPRVQITEETTDADEESMQRITPATHVFNIFSQYFELDQTNAPRPVRPRYNSILDFIASSRSSALPYLAPENRATSIDKMLTTSRCAASCQTCSCGMCTALDINDRTTHPIPSTEHFDLRAISSFAFDARPIETVPDMAKLALLMYKHFNLLDQFSISEDRMFTFLVESFRSYRRCNMYHNHMHAFDTTQCVFAMLVKGDAQSKFTPLELFSVLTAALLHDVDHDGRTNGFHVNSKSWLSLLYQNGSPQENHHASIGYSLLQHHNILNGFSDTQRQTFRGLFVSCILATDISKHTMYMSKLNEQIESSMDWSNEEHRHYVAAILLKGADVSNPARDFEVAKFWAENIRAEFFLQGDDERQLNLPFSFATDRQAPVPLPVVQISFINMFVEPLFAAIKKLISPMEEMYASLIRNRTTWSNLQAAPPNVPS